MTNGTLVGRDDVTDALAVFRVRPDAEPWPFTPGQYVTLGLPAGDAVVERPYSVASSARSIADGYELYVRLIRDGALTPRLFATRPGSRVSLRRPKGLFRLRPDDDRWHLFVATGCGVAPFASMLRTLRDDGQTRRVVLVHGVSHVRELGYRALFEELARDPRWQLTYVPTISRPADPTNLHWSGWTGRVEEILGGVCGAVRLAPAGTDAYVCGNPEMIEKVVTLLRERGFASERIHRERYWTIDRAERPDP